MERNEMNYMVPEDTRTQRIQRELDRLHTLCAVWLLLECFNSTDRNVRLALRLNFTGVHTHRRVCVPSEPRYRPQYQPVFLTGACPSSVAHTISREHLQLMVSK